MTGYANKFEFNLTKSRISNAKDIANPWLAILTMSKISNKELLKSMIKYGKELKNYWK